MFVYCYNNPINMTDNWGYLPSWNDIQNWYNDTKKEIANWFNTTMEEVKGFITDVTDYFTVPSEEEHYKRNENNLSFPLEYDADFFKGWDDNVSANCHQFSAPNKDNKKYVSKDGKYEAIYDVSGNLVTDVRDVGTYNFVSPNVDVIGHFIKDVIPWFKYGNASNDTTTVLQRIKSFIGIYE